MCFIGLVKGFTVQIYATVRISLTSLCGSCESLLSWDITDSYSLIFVASSLRKFEFSFPSESTWTIPTLINV